MTDTDQAIQVLISAVTHPINMDTKLMIIYVVILIIIVAVIAGAFNLARRSSAGKRISSKKDAPEKIRTSHEQAPPASSIQAHGTAENQEWLKQRWKMAQEHQKSGDRSIFPDWYFDRITDKQKKWLENSGIQADEALTKGQASDLIDLDHPPSEQQLEILRFFRIPLPEDLGHTRALHEISLLFKDSDKRKAWQQRPCSPLQKEKARFFGIELPENITFSQAEKLIFQHVSLLEERNDPRIDEWDSVENLMYQLSDEEVLKEVFSIKQPDLSLTIAALEALKNEGRTFQESEDNIELVVTRLLQLKPGLKR